MVVAYDFVSENTSAEKINLNLSRIDLYRHSNNRKKCTNQFLLH